MKLKGSWNEIKTINLESNFKAIPKVPRVTFIKRKPFIQPD